MASTDTLAARGKTTSDDQSVTLARLYVLRAMFLVWVLGGLFIALPPLVDPEPMSRGMLPAMLGGLWVMGFLGLRYPLQMLPIFLFEFAWKTIWLLVFGVPQWMSGSGSPRLGEDLLSIGTGPVVFALIIPWRYVYQRYIIQPAERWR